MVRSDQPQYLKSGPSASFFCVSGVDSPGHSPWTFPPIGWLGLLMVVLDGADFSAYLDVLFLPGGN
jgi:hypothetical protein